MFWPTLWNGGGLVGGDIYYYFLPQKAVYADALQRNELPVWNHFVGNGYPQMAETQTGALYPPFLFLYRFFDLNSALNTSIIGHYVLAFAATWLYARRIGLPVIAALFSALVYTYSWFPPRVSLEWAIVGGAWFPLALWCGEGLIQSRLWRYPLWLSVILALQMLAGHFLIAFLTQLTLALYLPARIWLGRNSGGVSGIDGRPTHKLGFGALAVLFAFLLASAQLIPTWELKTQSQRAGVTEEHNPGYGYIPPRYLLQIGAPWVWYENEGKIREVADPNGPRTNWVEAHLYFGILTIPLFFIGLICPRSPVTGKIRMIWATIGFLATVYATGTLVPLTNHLPGFSFFEGPGRYGIITTLAVALIAGAGVAKVNTLLENLGPAWLLWVFAVFSATTCDLHSVAQRVTHAASVTQAPVTFRDSSPIKRLLENQSEPTRMLNEGKNLPSLVGAGTYPVYLGLSPASYYDPQLMLPQPLPFRDVSPTAEQLDWMARHGVTHVLSLTEVKAGGWPWKQVWFGPDPCLNVPLARNASHGFYLYELTKTRGRVAWLDAENGPPPKLIKYEATRVEIETKTSIDRDLVLTDLAYPGWGVEIDGEKVPSTIVEKEFRGVRVPAGTHRIVWTYTPYSVYLGCLVSVLSLGVLLTVGHIRYWHPGWFRSAPTESKEPR